jgi:hypothetical protein
MQLSHGAYYAFYSIHLRAAGYSSTAVGALWSLGVLAEVLVFLVMHRILMRFGARRVLLWSLGLAAVRWLLIGAFVELVWVQVWPRRCMRPPSGPSTPRRSISSITTFRVAPRAAARPSTTA